MIRRETEKDEMCAARIKERSRDVGVVPIVLILPIFQTRRKIQDIREKGIEMTTQSTELKSMKIVQNRKDGVENILTIIDFIIGGIVTF